MIFGESKLTKKISLQTMGEVRCGIRALQCLQFRYNDLERILTFPEIANIESIETNSDI
jgi:hypothetical protein